MPIGPSAAILTRPDRVTSSDGCASARITTRVHAPGSARQCSDGAGPSALTTQIGRSAGGAGVADPTLYVAAILLTAAVTVVYVQVGGVRAVIWTDVIQLGVYIVGELSGLALIRNAIEQGGRAADPAACCVSRSALRVPRRINASCSGV